MQSTKLQSCCVVLCCVTGTLVVLLFAWLGECVLKCCVMSVISEPAGYSFEGFHFRPIDAIDSRHGKVEGVGGGHWTFL